MPRNAHINGQCITCDIRYRWDRDCSETNVTQLGRAYCFCCCAALVLIQGRNLEDVSLFDGPPAFGETHSILKQRERKVSRGSVRLSGQSF